MYFTGDDKKPAGKRIITSITSFPELTLEMQSVKDITVYNA